MAETPDFRGQPANGGAWRQQLIEHERRLAAIDLRFERIEGKIDVLTTFASDMQGLAVATTRSIETLRNDTNDRFKELKEAAKEASRLRLQRWSLVVACLSTFGGLSGLFIAVLKVLGH